MFQKFEIKRYAQSEFIEIASVIVGWEATETSWRFATCLATKVFSNALRFFLMGIKQLNMVLFEIGKILGVEEFLLVWLPDNIVEYFADLDNLWITAVHN
jgi:hypothetical protein